MKQLNYNVISASYAGENRHPQEVFKDLGLKVLHAVPQSISDSWWITVEDYDFDLPDYFQKMEYNLSYWRDGCSKNCEFFKDFIEQKDWDKCCYGGSKCLKKQ